MKRTETNEIGTKPKSLNDAMHQGKGGSTAHAVPDDLPEALRQGDKKRKVGFRDKKMKPESLRRAMRQ